MNWVDRKAGGGYLKGWILWRQPRALIGYVLAAELVAVGVTGYLASHTHPTPDDWLRLAVLAGMALLQAESTRKLEKTSRTGDATHVNVTSVWSFCGVIVLPAAMTGLLTIVMHAHLWARIWRTMGTRPAHRVLFSIAVIMLSARCVFHDRRLGSKGPAERGCRCANSDLAEQTGQIPAPGPHPDRNYPHHPTTANTTLEKARCAQRTECGA